MPQVPTLKGVRMRASERGRGQPMNDLVVEKSDLPPTKQNYTKLCYKANPTG
jgi:hypothetical protein